MKEFESRPIIALDFPSFEEVKEFLGKFPTDEKLFVKVGMELYYQEGPKVVSYLKNLGHSVFLDLKLYDIPNTVASSMKVLAKLGVDIIDLHAAGGSIMMKAAKTALDEVVAENSDRNYKKPILLAVTQLTSVTEEIIQNEQLVNASLEESVSHYAELAMQSGLDGVVCSAHEVSQIRQATREDFICLTPGIRLDKNTNDDQKRVMNPAEARATGSSYIVVGRPITRSSNPLESYLKIKADWNQLA